MRAGLPADLHLWQRIEAVLDLALDLPPEKRPALLDESCAGDPELRAQVEALLAADAAAGAFLGTPAGEYAPDLLAEEAAAEAGETDLAGRRVGRYRLRREIGSGGMGTVYEAEDLQLGRLVAVKLLPLEHCGDSRAKERFLREARIAAAVDHPNLCTLHDVGESDGQLYFVLSLYEGEALRERIRRGPLPLTEARDVAIQVARGLVRAHKAGIVHRDIKPANVMLARGGEVKILDFGIARREGDRTSLTHTGAHWGTPAYMSPEQARGGPVDGRTDVWSLGVLLYEMLAGRRPFGGESIGAVVTSILTQEPEPLERLRSDVPAELARVVDRALAKDPAERYASAAEMLADLEAGRAPERRPWTGSPGRTGLFVAGALVALAVLALALGWLWRTAGRTVRVAVLQPEVEGSLETSSDLAFVASDVLRATLAALVSLEGVQLLDPPERGEDPEATAARLREADEALVPRLSCRDDSCQVVFRRRRADGVVLEVSEPVEVESGSEGAYRLAEGVRAGVQQVYGDEHPLRSDAAGGRVRPEDYAAYIELERRNEGGERLGEAELERLDELLRTSPGLIGAYVLAAGIARGRGDFDRALDSAERARTQAPYDPRPLIVRLRAEIEGNRLDEAAKTLEQLETLAPGDIRVKTARADLLEARGELREALPLRKEVARRRPTWRLILKLAMLEHRAGDSASARQRLESLLAAHPDNHFIAEDLAVVETVSGDLERAAALYEELIRSEPAASYLWTNLGFVHYLRGEYAAAAVAYREALEPDPDDLVTRFNLATALEAQGDRAGARGLYRTLEKELAAAPAGLDAHIRLVHAQCLARLGRRAEAAQIAGEVLRDTPEDLHVLYQAVQVQTLLGEPVPALYYAKLVLEKGVQTAWLTIPELRPLAREPNFQALLDRAR